jgi:segregation and condensation protein B
MEDLTTKTASAELKAIIEALIFASPDPLTPKALYKLLATETKEDVQAAIAELRKDHERPGGLQLVEVAGGYQIVTRTDLHEWVRRLFHERTTQKLTVQALETLAVIAYKQPITAIEITEVRGVNTAAVLGTLLERHLIKIVGRKQVVGRPFMYATTKEFLIRFGLNDLSDLPKVEDMADALGLEAPVLVEQPLPDDQLPLAEPEADVDFEDREPPGGWRPRPPPPPRPSTLSEPDTNSGDETDGIGSLVFGEDPPVVDLAEAGDVAAQRERYAAAELNGHVGFREVTEITALGIAHGANHSLNERRHARVGGKAPACAGAEAEKAD